jgi:hypothetical protein
LLFVIIVIIIISINELGFRTGEIPDADETLVIASGGRDRANETISRARSCSPPLRTANINLVSK